MSQQQHKQEWGSRLGVILAVAGSAVGLGNFLRFPGNAAQNGGGAFMIPYFCALIFLGIPIGWAEWAMGRYGGRKGFHSAPAIMGVWGKGAVARYLGIVGVMIPMVVYFYYVLIESWCLAYAWHYLTAGGIGLSASHAVADQVKTSTEFFVNFTGQARDGDLLDMGHIEVVIFWLITFAVNVYFVYKGLSGGIEKFCQWAMPAMGVCGILVLVRVLTLGTPDLSHPEQNVVNGLGFMWNPDFGSLGNFKTWMAAAGQIFFSLSVGFGVIINYASYMKKKDDVVLSGLTASATNELFEVGYGGMITLTASFVFLGLSGTVAAVATGTFGLGFVTLPVVFAHMGAWGNVIGALWFFMLFLAAITSSLSMYQPSLAFFQESLGITRKAATTLMVSICLVGSFMVIWYSTGGIFWSTIDNWVGTFLIFILAAVQIIAFSWIFGIERGVREAHEGAHIHIPRFYRFIMKYVTPLYLIVVFLAFCRSNLGDWVKAVAGDWRQQLALGLVAAVTAFLVVCTRIGEKRWKAAGLDLDGRRGLD